MWVTIAHNPAIACRIKQMLLKKKSKTKQKYVENFQF